MKLVLLGSTGYHPNNDRHTACFMLPDSGVVFDAGTGFYRVRDHIRTKTLDVLLSHAHLDHVIGLSYVFDVLADRLPDRIAVHGRRSHLEAIERHLFAAPLFPARPPMDLVPLTESTPLACGANLTHFPLEHPGGAVGYRLDWPDRSMAYVTDTTAAPDADYRDIIDGVDLLLHECYFPDEMRERAELTGHSCASPVARLAAAAHVGRMVLVHINPLATGDDPIGIRQMRSIFPNTEVGRDGMTIDF